MGDVSDDSATIRHNLGMVTPAISDKKPAKPSTLALIAGSVVVLLVVLGGKNCAGAGRDSPGGEFVVACHDAIEGKLSSPGSAKWSSEAINTVGDGYVMSGDVDAQNGLGVLVRMSWTCTASRDSDDQVTTVLNAG